METIHVGVLRALAQRAKLLAVEAIDEIIYSIDTKILVGDIHRPKEKKPRKKRVKKAKVPEFPPPPTGSTRKNPPPPKMDLEKEYRAGRTSPILSEANKGIGDLPDADAKNPFYGKKREKKIDGSPEDDK